MRSVFDRQPEIVLPLKTIRSSWWWFVYMPPSTYIHCVTVRLYLVFSIYIYMHYEMVMNVGLIWKWSGALIDVFCYLFNIFGPPMFAIKYKFQFIKSSLYGVNSLCLLYRYYTSHSTTDMFTMKILCNNKTRHLARPLHSVFYTRKL